jgi:ureidoglycolate lyase
MRAAPLIQAAYAAFGDVVAARADVQPVSANLGFAERFDFLAPLENLRAAGARANLCVFRCRPMLPSGQTRFDVRLLERHPESTQAFIPMRGVGRYLVIVCLGGAAPDLSTLAAFVATGSQGITYKPGVWHHPLVGMDAPGDFACLVWEDGSAADCDVATLAAPIIIEL